jgi:hypothetical protein
LRAEVIFVELVFHNFIPRLDVLQVLFNLHLAGGVADDTIVLQTANSDSRVLHKLQLTELQGYIYKLTTTH